MHGTSEPASGRIWKHFTPDTMDPSMSQGHVAGGERPPPSRSLRLTTRLIREACLRYPLYSGCGRLAGTPPLRVLAEQLPPVCEARLREGPRILVPPGDLVGRTVLFFGDLDRKVSWAVSRLVRPGDTVIDVGANVGLITLLAARLVGPDGIVHAFEPQPRLAALLTTSVALNGYDHVTVHGVALGDREDQLRLSVPGDNAGAASFVRSWPRSSTITVPVVEASEYLERIGIERIRLVKIDVEGYEQTVLGGAEAFFERHPPDAILFECNERGTDFRDSGATRILTRMGYRFYDLPRSLWRASARPIDPSSTVAGHDILAVKEGAVDAEIAGRLRRWSPRRASPSARSSVPPRQTRG